MAATTKLDVLPHTINVDYFKDKILTGRSKEQGYNYFTLGYIHSVKLCEVNEQEVDIKALCYRSMRKNEHPHKVNITIRKHEKLISNSLCSCVAGLSGTCSHVIGLIHTIAHYQNLNLKEVPAELSATSPPQQWHKPRGKKIKPQPVNSMTLANPTKPSSERKREPVYAKIPDQMVPSCSNTDISKLKSDKNLPLSYLLQEAAPEVQTRFGKVQLGSPLYFHFQHYEEKRNVVVGPCGETNFPIRNAFDLEDTYKCCNEFTNLTFEEANILEQRTMRQVDCKEWFSQRKKRLTASQFGKIVKRKKQVNENFVRSIMDPPKFKSAATSYGICSENIAKERYAQSKKCHVHDCGLVVNPNYSFLGATPDGKVCIDEVTGILEIKCPFTVRDMTIEQALEANNFCLEKRNNDLYLKESHKYFCQVQGQLFVTCAPFCEFVVYTKTDLAIVRVLPDRDFQRTMFTKLCEFYKVHALNYLRKEANIPDFSV